MFNVIYILGLEHSGTTLLEKLLSCHKQIYGLGEIFVFLDDERRKNYLNDTHQHVCSCGRQINECDVWSGFINYVENTIDESYAQKYIKLIEMTNEKIGKDKIIVDSSKHIHGLKDIINNPNIGSVFVIHIIKDARAFAKSMKSVYEVKRFNIYKCFRRWHASNLQMSNFIKEYKLPSIQISYDDLCFNSTSILDVILSRLNLAIDENSLDLKNSVSHIGAGNPMRLHKVKSKRLIYDNRWFFDDEISFWYLLSPTIRKYNKTVYGLSKLQEKSPLFEPKSCL